MDLVPNPERPFGVHAETVNTVEPFPVMALVSSLGGLEALTVVLEALPGDFPAAVIALQHLAPDQPSNQARILGRRTSLTVADAGEGDSLQAGHVLVAPPAHHMLVGSDARVRLIRSGQLPPARPSADLLLVSLAVALGPRVIAVVLTGMGSDGALGTQAVHSFGGITLVQDPKTSRAGGMPTATISADTPRPALPLNNIAAALQALVRPHLPLNEQRSA